MRRRGGALGNLLALIGVAALGTCLVLYFAPARAEKPPPVAPEPSAPVGAVAEFTDSSIEGRTKFAPRHPELPFRTSSAGLPTTGTWRGYPLLQDFDADGRADLVVSNREEDGFSTWRSMPDGRWELRIDGLPRDMSYGPCAAADLDRDGKVDLLVQPHERGMRAFLNDGAMRWRESAAKIDRVPVLIDVAVADFDGDGVADMAGITHFQGGVCVLRGDGEGGLSLLPQSAGLLPKSSFGRDVAVADVDLDGVDDLVVASSIGLRVLLTRRTPALHWEDESDGLPVPAIGNTVFAVTVGRFAASEPRPQIAVCLAADPMQPESERDTIGVYAWKPEESRWGHVDRGLARGEFYLDLGAADFDADGRLDLIAMSIEGGRLICLGDGQGGFTPRGRLPGGGKGRLALGDVDGDGLVDVAISTPGEKNPRSDGRLDAFLNSREIWK